MEGILASPASMHAEARISRCVQPEQSDNRKEEHAGFIKGELLLSRTPSHSLATLAVAIHSAQENSASHGQKVGWLAGVCAADSSFEGLRWTL